MIKKYFCIKNFRYGILTFPESNNSDIIFYKNDIIILHKILYMPPINIDTIINWVVNHNEKRYIKAIFKDGYSESFIGNNISVL